MTRQTRAQKTSMTRAFNTISREGDFWGRSATDWEEESRSDSPLSGGKVPTEEGREIGLELISSRSDATHTLRRTRNKNWSRCCASTVREGRSTQDWRKQNSSARAHWKEETKIVNKDTVNCYAIHKNIKKRSKTHLPLCRRALDTVTEGAEGTDGPEAAGSRECSSKKGRTTAIGWRRSSSELHNVRWKSREKHKINHPQQKPRRGEEKN